MSTYNNKLFTSSLILPLKSVGPENICNAEKKMIEFALVY